MKKKIIGRHTRNIILANYVILPIICCIFFRWEIAIIGFCFAVLLDGFYPKWAYELSWEDIDIALDNLGPYGVSVSHICFIINGRKFFIYRDKKGSPYRYALRVPIEHWNDIYSVDEMKQIFKSNGGWWSQDTHKRLKCIAYFPGKKNLDACKNILRKFIKDASANLEKDVFAKVDYAQKDIWVKHPS